jgi:hypothetical protein
MPSAGIEPAIPANKRLKTYALDSAATVIGDYCSLGFFYDAVSAVEVIWRQRDAVIRF